MEHWIIEITWHDDTDLPTLLGPFARREEADEWVALNVRNGSADIRQLTYPYLQIDGKDAHISLT
jgi:hypothetical protein